MTKLIPFTAPIKIYHFKDEQEVSVNFLITESVVYKVMFTQEEFDYIADNWNVDDGVQGLETDSCGRVWWERRTVGPRPDCETCDHVVIGIGDYNFRFETAIVEDIFEQYAYQKANKMHWD